MGTQLFTLFGFSMYFGLAHPDFYAVSPSRTYIYAATPKYHRYRLIFHLFHLLQIHLSMYLASFLPLSRLCPSIQDTHTKRSDHLAIFSYLHKFHAFLYHPTFLAICVSTPPLHRPVLGPQNDTDDGFLWPSCCICRLLGDRGKLGSIFCPESTSLPQPFVASSFSTLKGAVFTINPSAFTQMWEYVLSTSYLLTLYNICRFYRRLEIRCTVACMSRVKFYFSTLLAR